jgi:N-acetylneuraminic acid mutarotase
MSPTAFIPKGALVVRPDRAGSEQSTKPFLSRIQKRPTKITCLKPPAIMALALAFLILTAVLPQPSLAAPGSWNPIGSMGTARQNHTATLLADGRVLVAGGYYFDENAYYLDSAELFNPAKVSWSGTTSLNFRRDGHTATLLAGGQVLVAGGHAIGGGYSNYLDSVEQFFPISEIWTCTGQLTYPRAGHTATLLSNGRVLVVGGYDGTR